ncbi:alpha-2-macroglobulin receptor-associated protein-like [Panonychus citri]|uniref:alpha-2-macroglobulin receptor-associated protein-like n=1 Tax=Panonychus citri TaxID=50023 RepID=UPI0023074064|nr:alpha-2-macroglobulin receptor-associated protein-like [Panonychus citri]
MRREIKLSLIFIQLAIGSVILCDLINHVEASISDHYDLKTKMKDRSTKLSGKEFEETNVQKLWDLALNADFSREEIESVRDELTHYENRIKKLRFFEEQLNAERFVDKETVNISEDDAKLSEHIKRKVKELNYKVDKVHNNLVDKILKRHNEL